MDYTHGRLTCIGCQSFQWDSSHWWQTGATSAHSSCRTVIWRDKRQKNNNCQTAVKYLLQGMLCWHHHLVLEAFRLRQITSFFGLASCLSHCMWIGAQDGTQSLFRSTSVVVRARFKRVSDSDVTRDWISVGWDSSVCRTLGSWGLPVLGHFDFAKSGARGEELH